MSEEVLAALKAAVNVARNECIDKVAVLRMRLLSAGHSEDDVREALLYWANREKSRP
jgi:hypothetical protein